MNSAPRLQRDNTCIGRAAEIGVAEASGTTTVCIMTAVPEGVVGVRRGTLGVFNVVVIELAVAVVDGVTEPVMVVGVAEVVVMVDEGLVEDPVVDLVEDLVELPL